ncbi:MAG: S8 family serine peptidase [Melioribacteraceae bacterium]|nr:S8 family serine peptidase [Melioribacteraceae bacterium]MDD3558433.1 S8 family serine peptidase [Melioribacteraceae bacterium]
MENVIRRFVFIFIQIVFIGVHINIIPQTVTRNSRIYIKSDSGWFLKDKMTSTLFKVDERSITVKLKSEDNRLIMSELLIKYNIEIELENSLGYIDLLLPYETDVFEIQTKLINSDLFDLVEINSFGKRLSSLTPNDPSFTNQYYLFSTSRPHINIPVGWGELYNFGEDIVIAVIDDGIDLNHYDLDGNVNSNSGWDYFTNQSAISSPNHGNNHATHVAGIIAAETNNNYAIAGIAGGWSGDYGPKLMSLKIINGSTILNSKLDDAILYAVMNGADIINMSLQSDQTSAIESALDYAAIHNVLLIGAGGNYPNETVPVFPARDKNVMAVAGINWKAWDHLGNTGSELEITAPGEDILSLVKSNNTNFYTGTSQAAPQVTGVAALLFSNYSMLQNIDVRRLLRSTADDSFPTYSLLEFGDGLLDASLAIDHAQNIPSKLSNISISAPIGGNPTISWNSGSNIDHYCIYRSSANKPRHLTQIGSTTNLNYTDNSLDVMNPKFSDSYYYRVTYVNNSGYESLFSDQVVCGGMIGVQKSNAGYSKNSFNQVLNQNYPNPFNPATTIKYSFTSTSQSEKFVVLKVYDLLGKEIQELVSDYQSPGTYEVIFDASGIASGVYFYQLLIENNYITRKLIVLE